MPALSYTQDFFGESVTTDSNDLVAPVPSAFATYQVDDEYVIGVGFFTFLGAFHHPGQKAHRETSCESRPFVLQPSRRLSRWT